MRILENTSKTAKHNKYLDIDTLVDDALKNPSLLSSKTAILIEELAEAIECIGKIAPDKYFEHYIHLHKIVKGNHFDESLYNYATSLMENVDGTTGAKWTISQIKEMSAKHGLIPNNIINDWDIGYIVSMYSSDLWDIKLTEDENVNVIMRASKGFLNDPDAPQQSGRALRFFTKVAMWNPEKH